MKEWLGTAEVAAMLDCSVSTVQRSLNDPARADELYGPGRWRTRRSPLARRATFLVLRAAVEALVAQQETVSGD